MSSDNHYTDGKILLLDEHLIIPTCLFSPRKHGAVSADDQSLIKNCPRGEMEERELAKKLRAASVESKSRRL